jgi:hypothetical protein
MQVPLLDTRIKDAEIAIAYMVAEDASVKHNLSWQLKWNELHLEYYRLQNLKMYRDIEHTMKEGK